MKKAILEFDLEDEYSKKDFEAALKGSDLVNSLTEIGNSIFRPARKHGYSDQKLDELIRKNPDSEEIIGILEKMFYGILTDNNVKGLL